MITDQLTKARTTHAARVQTASARHIARRQIIETAMPGDKGTQAAVPRNRALAVVDRIYHEDVAAADRDLELAVEVIFTSGRSAYDRINLVPSSSGSKPL